MLKNTIHLRMVFFIFPRTLKIENNNFNRGKMITLLYYTILTPFPSMMTSIQGYLKE